MSTRIPRRNLPSPAVCLVGLALLLPAWSGVAAGDEVTPVYRQFVEAKKSGDEPILPDFSYAGYHRGEREIPTVAGPIFDVTKYGGVADDELSDAFAIRKAIGAAEIAGGGVVFFPPGRFLLNTLDDPGFPIVIQKGHIVLRGSGYAKGGTILEMKHRFEAEDPARMYTTPHILYVKPAHPLNEERALANVVADARRETFAVEVDDASPFAAGQWVTLHLESLDAIESFLAPFESEDKFTRLNDRGVLIHERHSIARIEGNTLVFNEPLHVPVEARFGWKITEYTFVEEVGIEDICFLGGWNQDFIHHRSAADDGAFSAIRIEQAVNSWVRRCAFINWNHALEIRYSSYVSVLNVLLDGNKGHFGMHTREGYGVLSGYMIDRQGQHHGPSMGYRASGTVYWRAEMQPEQPVDSHSGLPVATLYDAVEGGVLYGSGGPWDGMPHHLRYYTLWNFHHRSTKQREYDMWRVGKKDRFVMPIVVGMYGEVPIFNEEHLQLLESHGTKVSPESLYEAQLELRLGALPDWVDDVRAESAKMRAAELPEFPRLPF